MQIHLRPLGHSASRIKTTGRWRKAGRMVLPASVSTVFLAVLLAMSIHGWGTARADTQIASASIRIGGTASQPAWEPAPGLVLAVADTLDPLGRIYDSPDFQNQLVIPGNGSDVFVLELTTQSVLSVPRESLAWNEADLPVPDLASALDMGGFLVNEGEVAFHVDGLEMRVQPEPPLVGEVSPEKLRASKPDYVYTASKYQPEAEVIEAMKTVQAPTEIAVFFGTWCTTCKYYLPQFMKIMEAAANPNFHVTYYGVSEDQVEPKEILKKYRNSATPAFIVLQGGKEIGRIEEEPLDSVGIDLVHILGIG